MTQELLYGTKPMTPQPINGKTEWFAERLRHGDSVIVELEPGDATYYNLLIVPAWGQYVKRQLGRFGIPAHRATEYLIVTKLADDAGVAFYARKDVGAWDLDVLPNHWTRELLSWWLRHLWREIEVLE